MKGQSYSNETEVQAAPTLVLKNISVTEFQGHFKFGKPPVSGVLIHKGATFGNPLWLSLRTYAIFNYKAFLCSIIQNRKYNNKEDYISLVNSFR